MLNGVALRGRDVVGKEISGRLPWFFIRCLRRLIRVMLHMPIAEGTGREPRVKMNNNPLSSSKSPADRHLWEIVPVLDFLTVGAAVFLLWFGYVLRGVFTPVLIGLGLAYLFNPVITKSQCVGEFRES